MRVVALDDVIASKEWADRPKDEALPELRQLRRAQIAFDRERGRGRAQQRPEVPARGEAFDAGPDLGP